MLGVKEIEEIIPHRHPFLLVDKIIELEPGKRAVGKKCITFDEYFFRVCILKPEQNQLLINELNTIFKNL